MAKRILFLVNGLGLGNSTRCHAVIEQLISMGSIVGIVTSGNGHWYFANNPVSKDVFEISQLNYSKKHGRLDILGTIFSFRKMLNVTKENSEILSDIIQNFEPDVVVSDSVYAVNSIKKIGIPLISLNNADVVVSYYMKYGVPRSVRFQFHAIERIDYLFNRFMYDLVISPSLEFDSNILHDKIYRTPPIVRHGLKSALEVKEHRAIIMLSGSTFGTQPKFKKQGFGIPVDVVGREKAEGNTDGEHGISFIGRTPNAIQYVNKSNLAVVNGGFSAVSEMFFRRCPMVVVPVPGHSEQYVNAKIIESLGVGILAEEHELENKLVQLIKRFEEFDEAYT
ncbi:hypothetical protein OAM32_02030, partial [Alphaproteobacteria bacterium]|nr:hypothetical protein [Alphaproteobacteria bacterium]